MGTEDKMSQNFSILRLVPFALALSLAGCGGFNGAEMANGEPEYRHPIAVDQDVQTLTIAAPRDKSGLTDEERRSVAVFASAYKERGHGPLTVSTPSGSPSRAPSRPAKPRW